MAKSEKPPALRAVLASGLTGVERLTALRNLVKPLDSRIQPEIVLAFPGTKITEKGEVKVSDGPLIKLSEPIHGPSAVQLFTWTSKMRCPSLSIPAGLPAIKGSCAMAAEHVVRRVEEVDPWFPVLHESLERDDEQNPLVCDRCYAKKGRYTKFVNIIIKQRIVREWMDIQFSRATRDNPFGTFVEQFGRGVGFLSHEFVREIMFQNGVDTRYFRLFDSGEVYKPVVYLALRAVALRLRNVRFWMPTRMWVYAEFRDLVASNPPPPNLVVRPSALFVGAAAPALAGTVPGFSAGTTVNRKEEDLPRSVWRCPAYFGGKTESCTANHMGSCRRCWDSPGTVVSYKMH